jgi:hypothetical protein
VSNHTNAEAAVHDLNAVPMNDVGHVLTVGIQGVVFALLDVADAIREQTARIEVLVTEAQ